MTSRSTREEVARLLAILGPRWESKADPTILTCSDWASIQIDSGAAELTARMDLVDQVARVIGVTASPVCYEIVIPGYWGTYATPGAMDLAGKLNGVPMVVCTLVTAAEMGVEVDA